MAVRDPIVILAEKYNLPFVGSVYTSSLDTVYQQFASVTKDALDHLAKYRFPIARRRATATSIASGNQGNFLTLFGANYTDVIPKTLWDNTSRRPLIGPVSDQLWQTLQANPASSASFYYKVMDGDFLVWPNMPAGLTLSCLVQQSWYVTDLTGVTYKKYPTLDTDLYILGEDLMRKEIEWRWLRLKGQPYADVAMEAEDLRNEALASPDAAPTLDLTPEPAFGLAPGIWVPAGPWNV